MKTSAPVVGAWTRCMRLVLAVGLLLSAPGLTFAETDIAGDWRGKLAIDGNTSLPVQFLFTKKADGSYSAVLNSLENQFIKNVAASSVSWKDGALKVEVPELRGSYSGTLQQDHFEGQWSQTGNQVIPLALSRAPKASKADVETLVGSWRGTQPGPARHTLILEFKQDANGGLAGSLTVPQQAAFDIALANLEVGAGMIAFKIPSLGAEYRGTFSGTTMNGSLKQGVPSTGLPLTLTKGDFAISRRLRLGEEAWKQLAGNWHGKVAEVDVVLRFTTDGNEQVAFLDVPQQRAMNIPVTSATVTEKRVVFGVAAVAGEFSGDLGAGSLTGEWTQGGKSTPVTWTKQ